MKKSGLWKMVCVVCVFCAASVIASPAQTLTTIYNFTGANGSHPYAGLLLAGDGNFYGTTVQGGPHGAGSVFKITPSGTLTTLHSFNGSDGLNPYAGLVLGNDGNFYGTTNNGGYHSIGEVFKITPGGTWAVLHFFNYTYGDGGYPGGLVLGRDGNLYGTTTLGGDPSNGTFFVVSPDGNTFATLYYFASSIGKNPGTALVLGSDGNFYGTAPAGGANAAGTVFKITPGGTPTLLYSFCSQPNCTDGASPSAPLLLASDGNFYGIAYGGGDYQFGTVFKITPSGALTTLHSFDRTYGRNPLGALIQAHDGNFYGTTTAGGAHDAGTIFQMTPAGVLTSIYSFNTSDGATPDAGLVQGTDGKFYGTTYSGGTNNLGTIFKLTPPPSTTTVVTSTPNPSEEGQLVTLTATVGPSGPPTPTGTVSFTSNGVAISGCTAVPLTSQLMAVCTTSTLAVGTDAIVATYSGDANYSGSSGTLAQLVNPIPSPLQFVAVTPCRLVDTRPQHGGSGPIQGGTFQSFPIPQEGGCNIPDTAAAYSLNVTVVPQGPLGYLTIWPTGEGQPVVSTMNSVDGRVKADAAIVPAGSSGEVSVYVTNTTDVILDIDGYFAPVSSSTLAFYPLTPCRVVDTRVATFPPGLGPPQLSAATPRDFPVLLSPCIPTGVNPAAYSFNFTVVPGGHPVGYLSAWPTGQSQPVVSTLNDQTGTIVANAAIVPAGTGGDISVYSTNDTQLLIDINGYFAPGPGGLSLYAVAPCRVIDTRHVGSGQPFSGTLNPPVDVVDSPCGPPATALAYVFNATVVPTGALGYLTLWPDGTGQPVVSTLNAFDGALTNNMAIVPTNNGKVDAFANGITQLILDISSYFAP
jgi:uncharacterized repeat protein (TIGR03803 family)